MKWPGRHPRKSDPQAGAAATAIPGDAPSSSGPSKSPESFVLHSPTGDVLGPGEQAVLGGIVVTVGTASFREPPLRVRRSHPGTRWLMAHISVENMTGEKLRMPDFRALSMDGSVGERDLCDEPGDLDGLFWLPGGSIAESLLFFAIPGQAGGVIEVIGRDGSGPTGEIGRWRFWQN